MKDHCVSAALNTASALRVERVRKRVKVRARVRAREGGRKENNTLMMCMCVRVRMYVTEWVQRISFLHKEPKGCCLTL